jgi:hypothetical protein
MSILLAACLAVAVPLVGLGIYTLQDQLEGWDQQRHSRD